ncbi:MAG TPA: CARDB domain-containing protein [Candidatus Nanoarchaeia archaeon]|nr:CARDB domain-containing protein [Candidatus Nanoarchaeia archaeon]
MKKKLPLLPIVISITVIVAIFFVVESYQLLNDSEKGDGPLIGQAFRAAVDRLVVSKSPPITKAESKEITQRRLTTALSRYASEEHEREEKGLDRGDRSRSQYDSELQHMYEKMCLDVGCVTTDASPTAGENGPNFDVKGITYTKKPEPYYQCDAYEDYCKGNYIIDFYCTTTPSSALGTATAYCPCGCSDSVCLKCSQDPEQPPAEIVPLPDLIVSKIYPKVYSQQCINSYQFEVCNQGDAAVEEEFTIDVTSNGVAVSFTYDFFYYPPLGVGECTTIQKPNKLNIIGFKAPLDTTQNVIVNLDPENIVDEKNEANNKLAAGVYTNDAYYFDETLKCDAFCYDSDGGKDVWTKGEITYKYNDNTYTHTDYCYGENEIDMQEYSCKPISYYEDLQKFSNPWSAEYVNCRVLGAKCVDGKCVPAEDTLSCLDNEGSTDTYQRALFKGTIKYTPMDSTSTQTIPDYCQDKEILADVICDYELKDTDEINCYRLKDPVTGKGHVCEDGICVPTDIDFEACVGPTESKIDPFNPSKVTETKLLGEVGEYTGWCADWNEKIILPYCINKYLEYKPLDCFNDDLNKDSQPDHGYCAWDQALGLPKCIQPDDSLKQCTDTDLGLDYDNQGIIQYVDFLGQSGTQGDECVADSTGSADDLLLEAYCEGNDHKMSEPYSCKAEGKVCINGECKTPNPALLFCNDPEGGPKTDISSPVEWIDIYGDDHYDNDYCLDVNGDYAKESSIVLESYCSSNDFVQEAFNCQAGTGCLWGTCLPIDESQKSCQIDPKNSNYITIVNKYGTTESYTPYCQNSDTSVTYYCSGADVVTEEILCPSGMVCNKWTGLCQTPDPSLASCVETADGVITTDEFGNVDQQNKDCDSSTSIEVPYCVGTSWEQKEENCAATEQCNPKTNSCQEANEAWVSCTGPSGPNTAVKEKTTAYNQFGEQAYSPGMAGLDEDICLMDINPEDYNNLGIVEVWCNADQEVTLDFLTCPEGTTCNNGICS